MTAPNPSPPLPGDPDNGVDRAPLIAAHDEAAAFFTARLHSHDGLSPRRYLENRGLGGALRQDRWTIGYAPAAWRALIDHLRATGFSDDELLAAGLALRSRKGNLIDRFRDRLTIGIHNEQCELIAFIGRAAPGAGPGVPKYLNSPQTALYKKREVLFGLGEQRDRLECGALPILVEGPLDALAVDATNRPGLSRLAGIGTPTCWNRTGLC